ncbi:hypothetical protein Gogos_014536 [Gossypium gossypioides]|uniref:Glycosyltransferase n=1 Tax=Gossypium gossypioides TaxID=34282 RepID=A0A7J9BZ06_GOSGO|nr:hypothetical protein [Gossypium gossypioides]
MAEKPRIVMLPTPGMGHLIPLIGFAKDLVHSHDLAITLIVLTIGPPTNAQKDLLYALPGTIKPILVPPVSYQPEMNAFFAITRSMSSIRHLFKSLVDSNRPRALVVDLLSTDVLDVAMEFNNETISCEFKDLPEPMKLPGSVPVFGRDFPAELQDRSKDEYKWLLNEAKRYSIAKGMILKSFKDLEPGTIEALQLEEPDKPAVYAIGPRLQTGSSGGIDESECGKWLDNQPSGSVLFVSFGSGEPLSFLPQGFLDRTEEKGLVVPSWAPQMEILGHGSTGGFLTHCGWNSVLESIANGVPMIAWPPYAEQRMNAVLLTEGINVALRPTVKQKGVVEREEIARVTKCLMKGDQGLIIREEMSKYKDAAAEAVSKSRPSTKALSQLVVKWKEDNNI